MPPSLRRRRWHSKHGHGSCSAGSGVPGLAGRYFSLGSCCRRRCHGVCRLLRGMCPVKTTESTSQGSCRISRAPTHLHCMPRGPLSPPGVLFSFQIIPAFRAALWSPNVQDRCNPFFQYMLAVTCISSHYYASIPAVILGLPSS